jgi:hypothetical protein
MQNGKGNFWQRHTSRKSCYHLMGSQPHRTLIVLEEHLQLQSARTKLCWRCRTV